MPNLSAKIKFPDGSTYEGEIRNRGEMHGFGQLRLPSGSFYSGGFADGEFHGQGKLTHQDGSYLECSWLHGLAHGYGVQKFSQGTKIRGEWEEGIRIKWYENNIICPTPSQTIIKHYEI